MVVVVVVVTVDGVVVCKTVVVTLDACCTGSLIKGFIKRISCPFSSSGQFITAFIKGGKDTALLDFVSDKLKDVRQSKDLLTDPASN